MTVAVNVLKERCRYQAVSLFCKKFFFLNLYTTILGNLLSFGIFKDLLNFMYYDFVNYYKRGNIVFCKKVILNLYGIFIF